MNPSSRSLRLLAAAAAASLFLSVIPCAAELTAGDKETARTLMTEGRDRRAKGDHKGALESFKAADAIMHVPTTGLEVGRTLIDLGLLMEARDTLLAVARSTPKPDDPEPFAKARLTAGELAESIAPRIASVTFKLTGVPPGTVTVVLVDGVELAASNLAVARKINPGAHVVVVKGGGAEKTTTFEVPEGATKEVSLDFSDAKPHEAPPAAPPDAPTSVSPLVWAGFGVGGLGLVAGSITGVMHLSKTSTLKSACPNGKCPSSIADDYDQAKTYGTISTISFVVAGVGAAVGVVGLLLPRKPPTAGAVHVTPWISVGMAGVAGSF